MIRCSKVRVASLAAVCATCLPGLAHANAGFGLNDGLADWTANGYAGEAAKAYDAGTAWTNPAGMVNIQGIELDSTINFIDPDLNFKGNDYVNGSPVSGPQSQHGIDPAISAGSGVVISLSPRLKFGFAAQSPFASRLSFTPENYVGRYQDINSIPTVVQGLFSLAYKIDDHLSIGGGPYISYFKDRQSHAIDLEGATVNGAPLALGPSGYDPVAQFRGDDLEPGYDIGGLYQFNSRFRIGVNYHSAVYSKLTGYQTIFIPQQVLKEPLASLVVPQLQSQIYDGTVKEPLPGWVDTSFYWQVTKALAIMGNATWTDWSIFQNSRIQPNNPAIPVTTNIQYNFHDTVTTGIGANYRVPSMPKLLLQTGVTYDQSPVDDANRQASIPDGDRVELGLGFTYQVTKMTAVQLAYTHYFFVTNDTINNSIGNITSSVGGLTAVLPSGQMIGHYDIQNDALAVGIKSFF